MTNDDRDETAGCRLSRTGRSLPEHDAPHTSSDSLLYRRHFESGCAQRSHRCLRWSADHTRHSRHWSSHDEHHGLARHDLGAGSDWLLEHSSDWSPGRPPHDTRSQVGATQQRPRPLQSSIDDLRHHRLLRLLGLRPADPIIDAIVGRLRFSLDLRLFLTSGNLIARFIVTARQHGGDDDHRDHGSHSTLPCTPPRSGRGGTWRPVSGVRCGVPDSRPASWGWWFSGAGCA
jgi:hypothetical protein